MTNFKHRQVLGGLAGGTVCLVAALAPAALHAGDCAPVAGSIDAAILNGSPVSAVGTVTGALSGATRAIVTKKLTRDDDSIALTLRHDFVTVDGGVLTTEDSAVWEPIPGRDGLFLMRTEYRITGGSGRWDGASGTLRNAGIVDAGRGTLTLSYEGQVCTQRSGT